MSALVFPAAPAVGQIFQQGESQPTYLWDGAVWKLLAQPKGVDTGGFRNLFMNGDMGIYQRNYPAANFTGTSYLADRWVWASLGTYLNVTWPVTTPGFPPGLEVPRVLQLAVNSVAAAGNYAYLAQKIEWVQSLVSGQPYTLSFWANTGAQALNIGFEIQKTYGSGGSPSAAEARIAQKVFTTTPSVWKRFSHTFIAPSNAGKTMGSGGDDLVMAIFWLDTGSTYLVNSGIGQQSGTWQFTGFQLERGLTATPFERRPPSVERALCQRYYNAGQYYMMAASPSTGGFAGTFGIEFPVTMRATPSMVRAWSNYGNVNTFQAAGTYPWAHYESAYSSAMGNQYGTFTWEANSEI